jgi:hypothetical protein
VVKRPGGGELLLLWSAYAAFAAAIVVTYARLPPAELYHVSEDGFDGGLGRALVFLNYPTALAGVAVLLLAADRLPAWRAAAWIGIALCAVTAAPGVVDQSDLDAKLVNLLPAAGVTIAVALAARIVAREGAGSLRTRIGGDRLRIVAAVLLVIGGFPWLAAEIGFYADDVPGLGAVYMSDEPWIEDDGTEIRAVHVGEHHGTDGMLLALSAILLSRALGTFSSRRLGVAFAAYLSLMLAYGVANALQDGWLEQVVKRGWSDTQLPELLKPEPTLAWCALLAAAAAVYLLVFRRPGSRDEPGRRRRFPGGETRREDR